jgi:hypothetical protein
LDYSDTTVAIPALEEPGLWKVVSSVHKALPGVHILVLWKGYNNKTPTFEEKGVETIKQESRGKGTVIIQIQKHEYVKTKIICFIDGDATYEPANLKKLIEMVRGGYDMALGNRFDHISPAIMPKFIQFGNKVITLVANVLYMMNLKDSQTGLRAIRTSAFQSLELKERYFGIESEMNIKMKKMGYKIGEAPADYYTRMGESKQMKLIDGIKLVLIDFKFLFYRPKRAKMAQK